MRNPKYHDATLRPFACLGPTTKDGVQYAIYEREDSAAERCLLPGWKRATREEVNAACVDNGQAAALDVIASAPKETAKGTV